VTAGRSANEALHDAMVTQMEAITAAARRQILENLAPKIGQRELKIFQAEFDRAIEAIVFASEASQFLKSRQPASTLRSQKIQADEDLRARS
jgi:hypothetical protein